jgi:hypothetical protein
MYKKAGTWAAPQDFGEASALIGILNLLPEQVNIRHFKDALWNLIGDDEFYDHIDRLEKESPTASKSVLIMYVKETLNRWLSKLPGNEEEWKEQWDPNAVEMLTDFVKGNTVNRMAYDSAANDAKDKQSEGRLFTEKELREWAKKDSAIIVKVTSLGRDIYKVGDNDVPVGKQELEAIVKSSNSIFEDEHKFWAALLADKEAELKVTADTGTVVDMYEVDYPAGAADNDIAMSVDPEKDLVSETVMPGVPVGKVNINVGAGKKSWREVFGMVGLRQPDIDFSNDSDSEEDTFYKKVLRAANTIAHCGDYGDVYWNPKTKTIWWNAADSDGNVKDGYDSMDMIREKFMSIEGVKKVQIEAEAYPPQNEGWIEIKQEIVPKVEEYGNASVASKNNWRQVFAAETAATEPYIELSKTAQTLYIEIISGKDTTEGKDVPVDTVVRMRENKDSGKWIYLFDCDSGEQGGLATDIPEKIKQVLLAFGHHGRNKEGIKLNNWRRILIYSNTPFSIVPIVEQDMPEIIKMLESVPQHNQNVINYIKHQVDLPISVKAVDSTGKILGVYLLGENSITNTIYPKLDVKEDLMPYADKNGLEGVALFVLPEYRALGVGHALKDYAQKLNYDYMWGYHLKSFNNLPDWLKRRRLVAEDPSVYITLRDKENT